MTDWDAEGLLDGLEGDAREARAELLDLISHDGVALDELRAAAAEDRLVLLPLERTIAGRPRYTADEVAERTGFDRDTFLAYRRAYGLAVPPLDESTGPSRGRRSSRASPPTSRPTGPGGGPA